MSPSKRRRRFATVSIVVVVLAVAGVFVAMKAKASNKQEPKLPVKVGKAETADVQVKVTEVGNVQPEVKVDVKSAVSGKVIAILHRDGDLVHRGDVLARVEPDLNQAQSLAETKNGLTSAQIRFEQAKKNYDQDHSLFEMGLLANKANRDSETEYRAAKQEYEKALEKYSLVEKSGIPINQRPDQFQGSNIVAPMDGLVLTKNVEIGESITSGVSSFNAGTVLFTVADLESLVVKVNLNEVDIAKVHVGQPVRLTLDAYPQKSFDGKVRFVAPAATLVDKIKVFEIEVALEHLDESFRTGMSANVEILGDRRDAALSIPLEALQRREGATVVYRLKSTVTPKETEKAREALDGRSKFVWLSENWKDYFEPVTIEAGIATLERVEVLAGLTANDQVALEDVTRKKVEKDDEDN